MGRWPRAASGAVGGATEPRDTSAQIYGRNVNARAWGQGDKHKNQLLGSVLNANKLRTFRGAIDRF